VQRLKGSRLNHFNHAPSNNSFNASGISSTFIDNLDACFIVCRRVNSGVRFLLNAVIQNTESANLNDYQAEDFLNASLAWML
jgi:hypothetical protein